MDNNYTSTPSRNPAIRNHAPTNSGLGEPTMPNEGSTSDWMNIYPSDQGALPSVNAYSTSRQMAIRQTQQQPPVFLPQPHLQSPHYQLPSSSLSPNFYSEPMTQSPQPSYLHFWQSPMEQCPNVLSSMHVSQQEGAVPQQAQQYQTLQQSSRLSQHQPTQQQLVSRSEFPSSQRQHHMAMERNFPQDEPLTIDQHILLQSQRSHSKVPPRMVVDSTSQTHISSELQEEIYQEIKSMKAQYFSNLLRLYQRMDSQAQEYAMSGMSLEDFVKAKSMLGETLRFLLISKDHVQSFMQNKLPELRRRIIHFTYSSIAANSSGSRSQHMLPHFHQRARNQEFLQRINTQQNMSQGSPQQMRGGSFYMNDSLQQNMSHPNSPLRYANSPLRISSPSMTVAPSPLSGLSGYSPIVPNTTTSSVAHTQVPTPVIGMPGITVPPLLADATQSDSNQVDVVTASPEMTPAKEPALQRLIKVMESMSPKALHSAQMDILSVITMTDVLACPAGFGNSRGAMGEDLGETTYLRLQAQNLLSQGESSRQHTRDVVSVPVSILSSVGSCPSEGFTNSDSPGTYQVEPAETFGKEARDYLLEEIKKINNKWFDMLVKVIEGDDWIYVAATYGEGTVVQCHLKGVCIAPEFRSHFSSDNMSPVIMPLRLLVPPSYPEKPPIVLDECEELDDLAAKARSKFRSSMCSLPQPPSLADLATAWRSCSRGVVSEYICAHGGSGTFSSIYGTWDYSK